MLQSMEACHKTGMNYPPLYVTFCGMSKKPSLLKSTLILVPTTTHYAQPPGFLCRVTKN